jgi:hypothetical protein
LNADWVVPYVLHGMNLANLKAVGLDRLLLADTSA